MSQDKNETNACIVLSATFLVIAGWSFEARGQCVAGGLNNQLNGLGGGNTNPHVFPNQCLAEAGTNVTITIEGMADLGCYSWDATHEPFPNHCTSCTPICCDTDPESKYLTVTGNLNALNPSVPGSTNMPPGGLFFQEWNTDCDTSSQACLEAGRSPCDPNNPAPNKRITTIPAETWNSWLGASGNTMTIRVTSTTAMATSLANY